MKGESEEGSIEYYQERKRKWEKYGKEIIGRFEIKEIRKKQRKKIRGEKE